MSEILLRFVHISDTHISADPHYNDYKSPHTPLIGARCARPRAEPSALPARFRPPHRRRRLQPGRAIAYHAARDILSAIQAPVYYLAGNHDDPAALQRVMLGAETISDPFEYEFEVNGVQIVTVDSNRPAEPPRGRVSADQLARLERICRADDDRPLIVATHHNVLPVGTVWWDEYMRMENGEDFHRALLPARDRLRGVFFGHVHQSTDTLRDGILYVSTPSSWTQIFNYPGQIETEIERNAQPGFSVVTITREQTHIRRHRFVVDAGSLRRLSPQRGDDFGDQVDEAFAARRQSLKRGQWDVRATVGAVVGEGRSDERIEPVQQAQALIAVVIRRKVHQELQRDLNGGLFGVGTHRKDGHTAGTHREVGLKRGFFASGEDHVIEFRLRPIVQRPRDPRVLRAVRQLLDVLEEVEPVGCGRELFLFGRASESGSGSVSGVRLSAAISFLIAASGRRAKVAVLPVDQVQRQRRLRRCGR